MIIRIGVICIFLVMDLRGEFYIFRGKGIEGKVKVKFVNIGLVRLFFM